MKPPLAVATLAAVVSLSFAGGSHASSEAGSAGSDDGAIVGASQVTAKPITGKLIVRVYEEFQGRPGSDESLMAKAPSQESGRYGVRMYVDGTGVGTPPMREPIALIAPATYRVSVAYPDRRYGYFRITTGQVKLDPGGGIVLHMHPSDRLRHDDLWTRRIDTRIRDLQVRDGATRQELIEELERIERSVADAPDQIEKAKTSTYLQQLSAQQMSSRVIMRGLEAYDQDAEARTTVDLEVNAEQARWIGQSIIDEDDLNLYSDREDSFASYVVKDIKRVAARAADLGASELARQALQMEARVRSIMSSASSVLRYVESLVKYVADRLDDTAQLTSQQLGDDPRQEKSGELERIRDVALLDENQSIFRTFYRLSIASLMDGKRIRGFDELPQHSYLLGLRYFPNGRRVIGFGGNGWQSGYTGFICEWDAGDGKTRRYVETRDKNSWGVEGLALSGDSSRAFSGSGYFDSTLRFWDTKQWKEIWVIEIGSSRPNAVAISSDGNTGAVALTQLVHRTGESEGKPISWFLPDRGLLSLRDMLDGKEVRRLDSGQVNDIVFSQDGRRLVSAGADGTVRVWEVATGKQLFSLAGHVGSVVRLGRANNQNQVLSGGEDGTLRLWDIATGKEVAVMKGHTGTVRALAVSPSGTRVLSGGEDHTWRLWRLPE